MLKLFSREGVRLIQENLKSSEHVSVSFFREVHESYLNTIEPAICFLQGKDLSLAHRIAARNLLPEGPRFQALDQEDLKWAFGSMGIQDQAKIAVNVKEP